MLLTFRLALMVALVSFVCIRSGADETALLKLQAKPGLVTRYKLTVSPGFRSDLKVKVMQGLLYKSEISSVSGQGFITSRTEVYEATVNDVKLPEGQVKKDFPAENDIQAPDGAVIRQDHKPDFIAAAVAMFFSENPVGVGAIWTHEYQASDFKDGFGAVLTFKAVSFENISGRETVQIETSFDAKDKEKYPNAVKGTVWVEKSTGDVIKAHYHFGSLMDINAYRISGNALDDERFTNRLKGLHTVQAKQTLDGLYGGEMNFKGNAVINHQDLTSFDLYENGRFVKNIWKGNTIFNRVITDRKILIGTYHFDGETLELVYQDKTSEKIKLNVTAPGEPIRPLKVTIDGKPYGRIERGNFKKDNVFDKSGSVVNGVMDEFDELYWE